MSTLIDLAIFPMDKGASVSAYVARAAAIIADSGLTHSTGPMGTSIEGEWEAVMDVVTRCMRALQADCDVDYRRGGSGRIASKLAALKHHPS